MEHKHHLNDTLRLRDGSVKPRSESGIVNPQQGTSEDLQRTARIKPQNTEYFLVMI
jgi:hypothetical protein